MDDPINLIGIFTNSFRRNHLRKSAPEFAHLKVGEINAMSKKGIVLHESVLQCTASATKFWIFLWATCYFLFSMESKVLNQKI